MFTGKAFQIEGVATGKPLGQEHTQMFTEQQGASVVGAEEAKER